MLIKHGLAFMGGMAFQWLTLPMPWLFGPLLVCLLLALSGHAVVEKPLLSNIFRAVLGVAAGAAITTTFFIQLLMWWPSLLLVGVLTLVIGWLGLVYFRRCWGYDFATAYYAAMPGGLQDMMLFGQEAGANLRALSLIHATRVLVIVVVLPLVLLVYFEADLQQIPSQPAFSYPISQLLLLAFCAIFGWYGAKKVGMFGASIIGPLLLTGLLSTLGVVNERPPTEAIYAAQYFIAIGIGAKYQGITVSELKHDFVAGLGFCLILLLLSVGFIALAITLNMAPVVELVIAITPGGQAELLMLALIVGADVTFIVAHHLLRMLLVIIGAPIIARLLPAKLRD